MGQSSSSTKKGILIGCGIALALGVCGVGSCMAMCGGGAFVLYEQTEKVAQEGRAFLEALGKGDSKTALEHASKGFRARVSSARVEQLLHEHSSLAGIRDVTFSQRSVNPPRAELGGTVTSSSGTTGVELSLVQQGDKWRVDSMRVAGLPFE